MSSLSCHYLYCTVQRMLQYVLQQKIDRNSHCQKLDDAV